MSYNKVIVRMYPNGNIKSHVQIILDLNKDINKAYKRYKKFEEDFKANVLKAQVDTSETDTLVNDTMRITLIVNRHAYTVHCQSILPNYEHIMALASLDETSLKYITEYVINEVDPQKYLTVSEFEYLVTSAVELKGENINKLDAKYTVVINLHDSYTEDHKFAIEYIIKKLYGDGYRKVNNVIKFESEDLELKKVIQDLSMSKYYDIQIYE